ncbi:MAG: polymerase subunit gamma/tau [Bacteroidota bacterium]|nr:polymerase subunit gamma/tau [Bacteroidota bacterium]
MEDENKSLEFIVTARKWRPQRFVDVIGQQHITTTLKNALSAERLHHAFLFSGPRGIGKTTTARILARAVNCLAPIDSEPCNVCDSCRAILDNRSIDVIEIDGASNNSVEDVRKLRENAKYPPSIGRYKVYIIDEVHMLSTSAFNALLKTLEEPPPHLIFIFATTESHKVPATITSRCQRYDFKRMEIEEIAGQLNHFAEKESITIEEEALITLAKKADGSMRDGQSLFDQVTAFCGTNIKYAEMAEALHLIDQEFFFRISGAAKRHDIPEMFSITQEVVSKGYDLNECLHGLLEHFRNLLTIKVTGDTKLIDSSEDYLEKYICETREISKADLLRILSHIAASLQALRYAPQQRIRFELALIELASMDSALEISELISEIRSSKIEDLNKPAINISKQSTDTIQSAPKPAEIPQKKRDIESSIQKEADTEKIIRDHPAQQKYEAAKEQTANFDRTDRESLQFNWSKLVRQIIKKDPSLEMLSNAAAEFGESDITIKVDNKFLHDILIHKKNKIEEDISEFFSKKIGLNFMLNNAEQLKTELSEEPQKENITPSGNEPINKEIEVQSSEAIQETVSDAMQSRLKDKHPVERAIIELFNAEEIIQSNT